MRRLALDYLSFDDRLELGLASLDDMPELEAQTTLLAEDPVVTQVQATPVSELVSNVSSAPAADKKPAAKDSTAPLCYNCGNQTQRAGSCYVCSSCGSTTGCS
jgi:ribonucleoside-diphosphate reductase alpha chain